MPFSVVADFGSAASIKSDESNLKHFKASEILTSQFGEKFPFGPSLANHGKGVPSRLVLDAMSTLMVRLFGKHRNAVLAMDPDQTGGGGILNAAANAATSAFASLDICWCSKLQEIITTLPAQNARKSIMILYERLGFKPKRIFQYYHAVLRGQYLQDNRIGISKSDEYDNYGFIGTFSAYKTLNVSDCDLSVQTMCSYLDESINELKIWQGAMGTGEDELFKSFKIETNDSLDCSTWKPTPATLLQDLPLPDYANTWVVKTDGNIAEFFQSLKKCAKDAIDSAKATALYLRQMDEDPTRHVEKSTETGRTFAVTDGQGGGEWIFKASTGRYRSNIYDPHDNKPKLSISSKCTIDPTKGWMAKSGTQYVCAKCPKGSKSNNHPSTYQGCPRATEGGKQPTKGKPPQQTKRKRTQSGQVCRNFRDFGKCKFGNSCIHEHTNAPPAKSAKSVSQDELTSTVAAVVGAAVDEAFDRKTKCVCLQKDEPGHSKNGCTIYAKIEALKAGISSPK
jgi:hypothetical protein